MYVNMQMRLGKYKDLSLITVNTSNIYTG